MPALFPLTSLVIGLSRSSNFSLISAVDISFIPTLLQHPIHTETPFIPTVCLMYLSSARKHSAPPCPLRDRHASTSSSATAPLRLRSQTSPTLWHSRNKEDFRLILSTMSGFLSSDAEAALLGEDEEALRLFYQNQQQQARLAAVSRRPSYQGQQWEPLDYPAMASSQNQMPLPSFGAPSQYVSWPSASLPPLGPNEYATAPYQQSYTPVVPSTPYPTGEAWPNAPWPALHPDDVEETSSASRSVSPNPADLNNFGILLGDGKTWRCGYQGCTSQAKFTRGCDLRKHFRRHKKSLFCRHDECPQSKEGGFSSKKDRDRHESKHKPGVSCSHEGCERQFSRVDNMKDHVRRIHGKKG